MMNLVKRLWSEEEGQGMVEYGLIIALISVVAITLLTDIGTNLKTKFTDVKNALAPATP
ncbi:MAG: Flp family type IVb pilin [Bacillota bacterium]